MENFLVEAGAELGTYVPPRQAPGRQCPGCRRKNSHPCFFAQGKRLTAHCCRDQSSLMEFGGSSKKKKSFLVFANFKDSVGKKNPRHCKK